jgi:excisionase family DNA binding protein
VAARPTESVPRIALTPAEAAAALGVSRRFLYEHVLPELRVVRVGRCRLVPVAELRAWCDANATRAAS